MSADAKQKMIEGAIRLLATRGLQATSFSEVLALTGAPRGSIYHHFPEGKNEMILAAIDLAGKRAIETINQKRGGTAKEVTEHFLAMWRELLIGAHFKAGCSVLAVTVAADSPALLQRAAHIFSSWRERLAELLEEGGLIKEDAEQFAATLVASSEGAVALSRAEQSIESFDYTSAQLLKQLESLTSNTIL